MAATLEVVPSAIYQIAPRSTQLALKLQF